MTQRTTDRLLRTGLGLSLALLALVAAAPLPIPLPAAGDDAKATVDRAVQIVAKALQDEEMPTDEKRRHVEEVVADNVHIATLSKLVLAKNHKKLSDEQKAGFEAEFLQHLINTYWRNAESATLKRIEVTGDREEKSGDWTVMTKIVTSNDDVLVDYRMRAIEVPAVGEGEASTRWQMIDIIIERVSLVANFRSQFQEIVSSKGVEGLIKSLRDKNAEARAKREKA